MSGKDALLEVGTVQTTKFMYLEFCDNISTTDSTAKNTRVTGIFVFAKFIYSAQFSKGMTELKINVQLFG